MFSNQEVTESESGSQQPPNPLFYLDQGAILVEDADEEVTLQILHRFRRIWLTCAHRTVQVFDLYANLATRGQENNSLKAGLGHVSANDAIYHVDFELHPISRTSSTASGAGHSGNFAKNAGGRSRPKKSLVQRGEMAEKTISVEIAQDLASLRNRKGDTGETLSGRLKNIPC
jgi:hypothetical protein